MEGILNKDTDEHILQCRKNKTRIIRRGQVFYADLGDGIGSEQQGIRPVVVVQNNVGNRFSPTIIVASLTSKMKKIKLPTHIRIKCNDDLDENSIVLLEQIRAIDKRRLKQYKCELSKEDMINISKGIKKNLGL